MGILGLWMALGGPHLDLVCRSGCQGWELWHRVPSCAAGTATLPEVVEWGDSSLEMPDAAFCLLSRRAGSACSPSPKPCEGPGLVVMPGL